MRNYKGEIILSVVMLAMACLLYVEYHQPKLGDISQLLPNHTLTPGATNPNVNQNNIKSTICVSGWTATIRPVSSYTTGLKIQQIKQYGYIDTATASYEEDHLISLELGGNPIDPKNLWPQSYKTTPNAKDKDKTENFLKSAVCSGRMTLLEAQKEISTDWVAVYNENIAGKFGSISSDNDDE